MSRSPLMIAAGMQINQMIIILCYNTGIKLGLRLLLKYWT